jgi:hypothetical protein
VWNYFRLLSGGLRYAATTGYYLAAFQAEPTGLPRSVLESNVGAGKIKLPHYRLTQFLDNQV